MTTHTTDTIRNQNNDTMETPMTIIDTVWEPHSVPIAYRKPSVLGDQAIPVHAPDVQPRKLAHSVHTHLPWHQNAHGVPPAICPETDIRETKQAYHIEMALAGVSDSSSVSIEWHAPRTLVVSGGLVNHSGKKRGEELVGPPPKEKVGRSLKKVGSKENGETVEKRNGVAPDGHVTPDDKRLTAESAREDEKTLFILKERRVGAFQRTFTMPVDVDGESCKAALEYGLLRIFILKKVPQEEEEDEEERLIGLHDENDRDELQAEGELDKIESAGALHVDKLANGSRLADGDSNTGSG